MPVTTIHVTLHADLLRDVDPIGLQREASARRYQVELQARLKAEFPKANVFLKWNPNRTGPADVFTIPERRGHEERVLAIVDQLARDTASWLSYDESVRAPF